MPVIINGSTGISGTDGSAGTPAVQGTDGNTGMYFPAADTVAVASGGSERMRIASNGDVSIGPSATNRLNLSYNSISGEAAVGPNSTGGNTFLTLGTSLSGSYAERARITSGGDFQFNSGYGSVATAFGCRAWALIEGSGTVFIRGSGNLSSVTDLGTGDYRLNYSTAMPNVNYAIVGSAGTGVGGNDEFSVTTNFNELPATTTTRIGVSRAASGTFTDAPYISIAVFR